MTEIIFIKAVIPAAGFGTRFLPATKSQLKEMLPVYDKPIIQYTVEEAVKSGIDDILIGTGRNKRSMRTTLTSHMNWNKPCKRQERTGSLRKFEKSRISLMSATSDKRTRKA